jgi:hypothetical protein
MKLSKFSKGFRQLILPMGVLAVLGLAIVSCSKKDDSASTAPATPPPTEEETRAAVKRAVDNMPAFELVMKDGKKLRAERTAEGGWTFSTPPSETGTNFVESTGTYTFVETSSSGGTLSVAASGFGGNAAGGGTIVAGSNSYNMQYTFCLSADEELFDLGLVDAEFDGVSMVIGIDGDLDALMNGDVDAESADFEDLFRAFAVYVVYDDRASGTYDIVNWITSIGDDEATLVGKGFAYIFDVRNTQLFFSKSGRLTVSGGSIGFSGKYLGIDFETLGDNDLDQVDFEEVDGFGALGCN